MKTVDNTLFVRQDKLQRRNRFGSLAIAKPRLAVILCDVRFDLFDAAWPLAIDFEFQADLAIADVLDLRQPIARRRRGGSELGQRPGRLTRFFAGANAGQGRQTGWAVVGVDIGRSAARPVRLVERPAEEPPRAAQPPAPMDRSWPACCQGPSVDLSTMAAELSSSAQRNSIAERSAERPARPS